MSAETISHFRIVAKLGAGGMGEVYLAEDVTLRRQVALKFMASVVHDDPDARAQLLQEARAASRLTHPNIATIYEVGEHEGKPFIAMELVSGHTLKTLLERGPIDPPQLADIARQIAEGLKEAHEAGLVHRDIKPANVMVDTKGRVKILDFGLAGLAAPVRAPGEREDLFVTRTAQQPAVAGTQPYMSPEQLRGETIDQRSDIFSFGVMMYECLTGRRPFRGDTSVDVMHAILRERPTPLSQVAPEVPAAWNRLVDRCLEKSRDKRCESMAAVLELLRTITAPDTERDNTVAVLYLQNLSGAAQDEYFRDGITEDIIIALAKIQQLRVYPRDAVMRYRDKSVAASEIGRELHAAYVVGGSLRRAGDRLRVTAQLIDVNTGYSLWAERYDRQLQDVFAIQDEIAQNIARSLRIVLTEEERRSIEKPPTADVQAYDHYLQGRRFFYEFRQKGFDVARRLFARAIELDPGYARAYAGIADCCSFLYLYWHGSEAALIEADAASRKAVELDPELAEAHASRGLLFSLRKNHADAEREFDTALRLNPNLYEGYYFYARAQFTEGKFDEAAPLLKRAAEVNPDQYQTYPLLGMVYVALGRQAEADAAYRQAVQVIERYLDVNPDDVRARYLGAIALYRLGDRTRSAEWAETALALEPDDPGVLYNIGCAFALLGDRDRALDCLDKTMTAGGTTQKQWMLNDPDLASLHDLPRFQALLDRLK